MYQFQKYKTYFTLLKKSIKVEETNNKKAYTNQVVTRVINVLLPRQNKYYDTTQGTRRYFINNENISKFANMHQIWGTDSKQSITQGRLYVKKPSL